MPILRLMVIRSSYATTDLNVRTEAKEESSVGCVVPAGRKLSITATVINEFRCESYRGKGPWGSHNSFFTRGD
jgi:uncharacterized protein YgiM (DUF1202 family)